MPKVDKKYERAVTGGKVIPHKQGVPVFNGPFGRQPRKATFSVCRARSSSASTGSASFPARHTFVSQPEGQQHSQGQDWSWPVDDSDSGPTQHSETERCRRQRSKQQQDILWKERQPEHRFRRYCYLSGDPQRRANFTASVIADFDTRLSAVKPYCHTCKSAQHLSPSLPAAPITFACINGYATVRCPQFLCSQCGKYTEIHPISVGCFPATPSRPEVWYDNQLLALTSAAQLSGPTAIQAHCSALKKLYLFNCPDSGRAAIWSNLGMAARQWQRVEVEVATAMDCGLVGILEDQPAAWQQCPCCWQTCQAAIADACLGLTHLRSAASNMHGIQPYYDNSPFLPDEAVQNFIEQRRNLSAGLWEAPSCVDFKAVGTLGRRSGVLDIFGMAALVCRHEFVMVAANLFTEENFAYYDLMLSHVAKEYQDGHGRKLVSFFLDIACQFSSYWNKHHPDDFDLRMAIGAWHARVHKPDCQRQFGARRIAETGLTSGDNVEHLWSCLRKPAHLLKYMSKAHKQDAVTDLIRHREVAKEDKLAATLACSYNNATTKGLQYEEELRRLQAVGSQDDERQQLAYQGVSSLHTPVAALDWTHAYQECLEKQFLLIALQLAFDPQSAEPLAAHVQDKASSLTEHNLCQDLAAAAKKAREIEAKKGLTESWTQDSVEYQLALQQRKCFWVNRLHRNIAADLDSLHVAKLTADRTSRQHRSTSSSLKKQSRATRIRLEKSILLLRQWHAVTGDIGNVLYDPALLSVADMEQKDWVLPWFTCNPSQSALHDQVVDLEHRIQRCKEEQCIVVRETDDAVIFYSHQLDSIQAAMLVREEGCLDEGVSHAIEQMSALYGNADAQAIGQQYLQGQLHILHYKRNRCQHLLTGMQDLQASLTELGPVSVSLASVPDPVSDQQEEGYVSDSVSSDYEDDRCDEEDLDGHMLPGLPTVQ